MGFGGISKDSVGFGGIFGGLSGFQWDFRGAQWDVCLFAVLCGATFGLLFLGDGGGGPGG